MMSVTDDSSHEAAPVTSNSITDPYGPRRWNSNLVKLAGRNRALNEFSVERVGEEVKHNLVMLHGYGAGLGFFYKNFEPLSRTPGWKLYALDMLGMGRSSRPPFRIHAKDRQGKITEAENWFIDALEEWRVERKIDKMTLLGHSLGGYMAVAYALKYPGRLEKLVLASPVGIPEDPYAVSADLPEPEDATMASEFTQDQGNTVAGSSPDVTDERKIGDNNNSLNARSKAANKDESGKPPRKPLPKCMSLCTLHTPHPHPHPHPPSSSPPPSTPFYPLLTQAITLKPHPPGLTYLWDQNISPFSLVRWSGPFGPRLVSGWTSRRFSHLGREESQALHDYSYSLFRQRGSGEYALAYVLAPGAFARSPLIRRIHAVGRQFYGAHAGPVADGRESEGVSVGRDEGRRGSVREGVQRLRENGIPVVLMYGEHDWMDINGGHAAQRRMADEKRRVLAEESGRTGVPVEELERRDNGEAKVVVIRRAGHHVYLDNPDMFNEVMREEMGDVEAREGR